MESQTVSNAELNDPDTPHLSVVIPAYNEAARLPSTLDKLRLFYVFSRTDIK